MPAYRWPRRVCPGMREFLGRPCLRKVTRLLLLMEALEAGRAQNQEGLAGPGNRFVLPQTRLPLFFENFASRGGAAPRCGHGLSSTEGIGGCAAVVLADGDGRVTGDALAAEGRCCSCRLTPHFLQNLARAATTRPQAGHEMVAEVFATGVPHAPQTSAFGSISLAQLWQCIAGVFLAATPLSAVNSYARTMLWPPQPPPF